MAALWNAHFINFLHSTGDFLIWLWHSVCSVLRFVWRQRCGGIQFCPCWLVPPTCHKIEASERKTVLYQAVILNEVILSASNQHCSAWSCFLVPQPRSVGFNPWFGRYSSQRYYFSIARTLTICTHTNPPLAFVTNCWFTCDSEKVRVEVKERARHV